MFRYVRFLLAVMFFLSAWSSYAVNVGDPAPGLQNVQWIKNDPVDISKGKGTCIYIIEFWATWCGPCKESIPHLTALQEKYRKQGLVIAGISIDEDVQVVKEFVLQNAEMKYNVGFDTEGKTSKIYMTEDSGIPTAFVIDKSGTVAWIGHPMELDPVLKAVAAGTWGVEKAAKGQQVGDDIQQALRGRDLPKALSLIEAAIKEDPTLEKEYGATKVQVLVVQKQAPAAVAYATSLWKGALKDDGEALNEIAWTLVDPESGLKLTSDQLDAAGKIAASAVELTKGEDAAILDTQARVYATKGDFAKAIQIQTKAIEKASDPRMKADLQKTLAEYKSGAQEV